MSFRIRHVPFVGREAQGNRLSFFDVLAELKGVEKLYLHVAVDSSPPYAGQLGQEAKALRDVEVRPAGTHRARECRCTTPFVFHLFASSKTESKFTREIVLTPTREILTRT